MCGGGERATENPAKAFIIGHLGNTMMIHQHRQVWLRSPTHLEPSLYISYQGMRHDSIVPCRCELGEGELDRLQVLVQRWRVDTVPKYGGHQATQQRHMEAINTFVEPAHTPLSGSRSYPWLIVAEVQAPCNSQEGRSAWPCQRRSPSRRPFLLRW